jgi:hypothetical protein
MTEGTENTEAAVQHSTVSIQQSAFSIQPCGDRVYAVLADAVLVTHLGFVLFVVFGGLLVLRWPSVVWVHVPAALWGVAIEYAGWICPLTPLENDLRARAGEYGYEGDFVARYLLPVIYPEGLTREAQFVLGSAALLFNIAIYVLVWRRHRKARRGVT